MTISIEPAALKEIHLISEKAYPNESCGFLFGSNDGIDCKINRVHEVINNDENSRVHYTIPPKEFMKAERFALENNLALIGVFHSHPEHPPMPSGRDLDDAIPEFSYFITSVHEGQAMDTRSWRLNEDRLFVEEPIEIVYKNKLSKSITQQHG